MLNPVFKENKNKFRKIAYNVEPENHHKIHDIIINCIRNCYNNSVSSLK